MATVITSDNVPAVLAQTVERQDEQDARIEALLALQADHAIRDQEREQQLRVQATALRATAAQLSRYIADASKPQKGNRNDNGDGNRNYNGYGYGYGYGYGNGTSRANGNGNRNSTSNGSGNPGRSSNGGIASAGLGGEANLGPFEASADIGGQIDTRQACGQRKQALEPPSEPERPQRRRAHRWV